MKHTVIALTIGASLWWLWKKKKHTPTQQPEPDTGAVPAFRGETSGGEVWV